ncbi:MAG: hypothetical protein ACU837_14625 [Gammaproteobacteria bacterium]
MININYFRQLALASLLLLASTGTVFSATTSWTLIAGQTMPVGTVTVTNDATNLYVTYALDNPAYANATFGNLQVFIGQNLNVVPANNNGTPIPGQFCQAAGGACYDATGLKSYTFTVPFSVLGIADINDVCGTPLSVVTHAEVDMDGDPSTTDHETAFGGDSAGGGPRWWFYGTYTIDCSTGEPPLAYCETAFAKGGYIWTTDKKSNPENLPSLMLTKNRWGWAIKLTAPGTTSYDLWAGAGLNNTSKATKVGTVTVSWDGAYATVTYNMLSGKTLKEVHLYAGDVSPTTLAPGQFGNLQGFDPAAASYSFNDVELYDNNGDGSVWLIAHAVACY